MAGFAAGFFGAINEGIDDKKEYIRERVDSRREELRQRGLERMAQVNDQRNSYETAARGLMRMSGVNSERIISALQSDPDAVIEAYNMSRSNPDITGSAINQFFNAYDAAPSNMGLTEALNSILPYAVNVASERGEPDAVERFTFARLLGLDTEAALDEEVYNADIVNGMTGDQILASINTPVRARGTGNGAQLDFSVLNPQEDDTPGYRDFAVFDETVRNVYLDKAETEIARLESMNQRLLLEDNPENAARVEANRDEIDRIAELIIGEDVEGLITRYGRTALDRQLRMLPEPMRPLYLERLYNFVPEEEEPTTEEDDTEEAMGEEPPPPDPGDDDLSDPTPEPTTEPASEVDVVDVTPETLAEATSFFVDNPEKDEVTIGDLTLTRDEVFFGKFSAPTTPEELAELEEIFKIYSDAGLSITIETGLPGGALTNINISTPSQFEEFKRAYRVDSEVEERVEEEPVEEVTEEPPLNPNDLSDEELLALRDSMIAEGITEKRGVTLDEVNRFIEVLGIEPLPEPTSREPFNPENPEDNRAEDFIRRNFNAALEAIVGEVQRNSERVAPVPEPTETPDRTVPEVFYVIDTDDPQEIMDQVDELFAEGNRQVELVLDGPSGVRRVRVTQAEFNRTKESLLETD